MLRVFETSRRKTKKKHLKVLTQFCSHRHWSSNNQPGLKSSLAPASCRAGNPAERTHTYLGTCRQQLGTSAPGVITDDNSVMQTFWHSINITESAVLSNYIPAGQLTMLALGIHWSCRIGHMCCCVEFQDTASRDDADGSGQAAKHLSVLLAHLWNMPFPMEQQQPWDQPWQVDSQSSQNCCANWSNGCPWIFLAGWALTPPKQEAIRLSFILKATPWRDYPGVDNSGKGGTVG